MKTISIVIILIAIVYNVSSQNSTLISGRIEDNQTKEPLPYANVVHVKKSLGTISNIEGEFILSLYDAEKTDSIVISYLGYESIKTTVSECLEVACFKLSPQVNEIAEVRIRAEKFKLKSFIVEVISAYNKNRRSTPHIAVAHYREKAKEKGKYIMFMESIGYSVCGGEMQDATPLSNYKFFCENTKSYSFHPEWTKYGRAVCGSDEKVSQVGGGKNQNILRRMELRGVLSERALWKYRFKLDSSYYINNHEILVLNYKGNNDEGTLSVNRNNFHIVQIKGKTNKVYHCQTTKVVISIITFCSAHLLGTYFYF